MIIVRTLDGVVKFPRSQTFWNEQTFRTVWIVGFILFEK